MLWLGLAAGRDGANAYGDKRRRVIGAIQGEEKSLEHVWLTLFKIPQCGEALRRRHICQR